MPSWLRAKNLFASAFWKKLATIDGKAQLLGAYEVFEGDYQKLFDAPAAFETVTRRDVQKAAALVFQNRRRTVGVLDRRRREPRRRRAAATEAKP